LRHTWRTRDYLPPEEDAVQPDPSTILEVLSIREPLIGLYDAPDPAPFAPLVEPAKSNECVFASYPRWGEGKTLHITKEKHGCGAPHLLGLQTRSREKMVAFLVDEEGLRADHELMEQWLDAAPGYQLRHEHVLIGPLHADQYDHLRTITFYVNPDQLAVLVTGSSYYSRPDDPPVVAPFSSGCGQLAAVVGDLDSPRAVIGATDQAMRRHLDPMLLAFTVTKPMFERLCSWADDEKSSLHNNFLKEVLTARGGSF
jgi:hypothetical protein